MTTKVVYNACFGGFSVSMAALMKLRELGHKGAIEETLPGEMYPDGSGPARDSRCWLGRETIRHDPMLVRVVEEMGEAANGGYAELKIATIDGNRYRIHEYDGAESVQEPDDLDWIEVQPVTTIPNEYEVQFFDEAEDCWRNLSDGGAWIDADAAREEIHAMRRLGDGWERAKFRIVEVTRKVVSS